MKWSAVPHEHEAFNQTLSTPFIIHSACMDDSRLLCVFKALVLPLLLQSLSPLSSLLSSIWLSAVHLTHLKSLAQQGVCNPGHQNKLQQDAEHTQICPCINMKLYLNYLRSLQLPRASRDVYEPEVHFHTSRVRQHNCPISNLNS